MLMTEVVLLAVFVEAVSFFNLQNQTTTAPVEANKSVALNRDIIIVNI